MIEDGRQKTEDGKQKMDDRRLMMGDEKKMSRRRFLALCGRISVWGVLASLIPIRISYKDNSGEGSFIKRFSIKVKPFNKSNLYKKHNLSG
jgi:hypothetical protein